MKTIHPSTKEGYMRKSKDNEKDINEIYKDFEEWNIVKKKGEKYFYIP